MRIDIDGFYGADEYDLLAEFFAKAATLRRLREAAEDQFIQEQIDAADAEAVEETAPPEAPEAPKRKRRTKAEIEAANADKAAEAAAEEP
ncbi:MAG TPA: hypothetical protein PLU35_14050, partial [Phycisphaerales bacterium]|nr:hypothetical protein [Phycisphaerales bacterium]